MGYVAALANQSSHPLSRMIRDTLASSAKEIPVSAFTEKPGQGVSAQVDGRFIQLGSASYLGLTQDSGIKSSRVYLTINEQYRGFYQVENVYREGLEAVLQELGYQYKLHMLSGDEPAEKTRLEKRFPAGTALHFKQTPLAKLSFIEGLQNTGSKVIMVGDGLNDAGALKQSNIGIAITEDVTIFSPSCDAILDASAFRLLPAFTRYARVCLHIIYFSFGISLLYNIAGLSFAVQGKMSPLLAAILMPLSSDYCNCIYHTDLWLGRQERRPAMMVLVLLIGCSLLLALGFLCCLFLGSKA